MNRVPRSGTQRQSATGRGDLLRGLAAGVESSPKALGFERSDDSSTDVTGGKRDKGQGQEKQPPLQLTLPRRSPLHMPFVYSATTIESPQATDGPTSPLQWTAMPAGEWVNYFEPLAPQPLVHHALWPDPASVRRLLDDAQAQSQRGRIDWSAATRRLANGETLPHLPRQTASVGFAEVHLLLDGHPAFAALEGDARVLVGHLLRLCGNSLKVWRLCNGPLGPWVPLGDAQRQPPKRLSGALLLMFSDMGVVKGDRSDWVQARESWRDQGAQTMLAFPGSPDEWPTKMAEAVAFPRQAAALRPDAGSDEVLNRLLQALSVTPVVDAPLVRALRQTLFPWASALLELQVWQHPDLWGSFPNRQWRSGRSQLYAEQLASDPFWNVERLCLLTGALQDHHGHLSLAVRDEEILNLAVLAPIHRDAQDLLLPQDVVHTAASRAAAMAGTLQHSLKHPTKSARLATWAAYAQARFRRMNQGVKETFLDLQEKLGALEALASLQAGPGAMVSEDILKRIETDPEVTAVSQFALVQQGARLVLLRDVASWYDYFGLSQTADQLNATLSAENAPGLRLQSFKVRGKHMVVTVNGSTRWWDVDSLQRPLVLTSFLDSGPYADLSPVKLSIGWQGGRVDVERIRRPFGVVAWRQGEEGVFATLPVVAGEALEVLLKPDGTCDPVAFQPPIEGEISDGTGAVRAGVGVDRYGVYSTSEVWGPEAGSMAVVRFRYLPPGTFLMGSPDGVGFVNERPQHPVTLTEGFWMAEVPCTQILWNVVMGSNPKQFQGENQSAWMKHPVDSVSFEDVRRFLDKFQALLPAGVRADLPTEAEWEYACRSGTHTAYWWGDDFDPACANVEHTGKESWGSQDGTTPVDHYPPNPWGLYDMHGNVWEWCADARRDYTVEAVVNPTSAADTEARFVRGGSWTSHPTAARSAYRSGRPGGGGLHSQGFRFLLRSSSLGPEGSA